MRLIVLYVLRFLSEKLPPARAAKILGALFRPYAENLKINTGLNPFIISNKGRFKEQNHSRPEGSAEGIAAMYDISEPTTAPETLSRGK